VIFRDLKPANILVRSSRGGSGPDLAVVDFGIARQFQAGAVGTVIGTPGYAPPEQYQGLATPHSDIYALGATLHRVLTGYDPESGAPFTFPAVRTLNPAVSPELAAVVERAVSLNPADRYASADELSTALERLAPARYYAYAPPRHKHAVVSSHRTVGLVAALMLLPVLLSPIIRAATLYPSTPDNTQYQWSFGQPQWAPRGYDGSGSSLQPNPNYSINVGTDFCNPQVISPDSSSMVCSQNSDGSIWVVVPGQDQWDNNSTADTSLGR
jgi:serine/threonine protein kinase